jgi:hypothetical protein
MARRVGSAMAWKISRRTSGKILFEKPIGCKYMRNYSVSQFFFSRNSVGSLKSKGAAMA